MGMENQRATKRESRAAWIASRQNQLALAIASPKQIACMFSLPRNKVYDRWEACK